MRQTSRKLLFVGPSRADFDAVADCVEVGDELARPVVQWAADLATALAVLREERYAAILLDLNLADSEGLLTLDAVQGAADRAPILIISPPEDETTARSAVKWGARDYAIKGRLDFRPLSRTIQNLIDRQIVDDALYAEKERAEVTLNSIADAVLCSDAAGQVTYLNAVAERMTGWSRSDAAGRPTSEVFAIIDAETRRPVPDPLALVAREDKATALGAGSILVRRDGFEWTIEDSVAPIHDRSGNVTGAVVVFRDVTKAHAETQKLSHMAQHDILTDLPNRALFADRLEQAIGMARRHQRRLAVLFMDCDGFKKVNDTLGHDTGDLLLQSIAKRLVAVVRTSDTVSRQGGDEFVILLSEMENPEDAAICANKIAAALSKPHQLGQFEVNMTASIGIAVYPTSGRNADSLVKAADAALYEAKESGGNTHRTFSRSTKERAIERQSIEESLLQALEQGEFCLHYQPRVELATGALAGVEALLRWNHPQRGLLAPKEFIPIAEESGLIVPIGRWVLAEACRQMAEWRAAGIENVALSVNVSAVELRGIGYPEGVNKIVTELIGQAEGLELELTESVLMNDAEATAGSLTALRALGLRLALDDFGTGFSSLSYLRRFPINTLKIDQSFVKDLAADAGARMLVSAIIGIGKGLGQTVIAEGIETEGQLEVLRDLRCDGGQGFLFSRPLPAADAGIYLAAAKAKSAEGRNASRPVRLHPAIVRTG